MQLLLKVSEQKAGFKNLAIKLSRHHCVVVAVWCIEVPEGL